MITKRDRRYVLGILHSIQFVSRSHGIDSVAEEMIRELLQGWPIVDLKQLAKDEDVIIDWYRIWDYKN